MPVKIELLTANAAFADGNGFEEAANCVEFVSTQIRNGVRAGVILDSNNNAVGRWSATIDADSPSTPRSNDHG